jgi:hypothetical protein
MHPQLKSNKMSKETFEESQFFTEKFYHKGIAWYLNSFDSPTNLNIINFEKSANYFTEPKAALRIKTLLKNVKIIYILIDPIQRAYSWYQVAFFGKQFI